MGLSNLDSLSALEIVILSGTKSFTTGIPLSNLDSLSALEIVILSGIQSFTTVSLKALQRQQSQGGHKEQRQRGTWKENACVLIVYVV
jgi:hypothetical protein